MSVDVTLNDLVGLSMFQNLELIAGEGGLSNRISSCAMLDYEFVKSLKERYLYSNFHNDQLVLTSFSYARDEPYLVRDAVRHLVSVGASGLVVNNVFHIELPESALRYAKAKRFPVFLAGADSFDPCQFAIDVHESVQALAHVDFGDREIGALLHASPTAEEVRRGALRLNPSFDSQIAALYLRGTEPLEANAYIELVSLYRRSPLYDGRNALYRYRGGLVYVISGADVDAGGALRTAQALVELVEGSFDGLTAGLGDVHYSLHELDKAVREALYAQLSNHGRDEGITRYADLGLFQALLPFAEETAMTRFSQRILEPLVEHDAAYNTQLLSTLTAYVDCRANIHDLATRLGQHENTCRYRFSQVEKLVGLNPIRSDDYAQIAIAVKVRQCGEWMGSSAAS